MTEDVIDSHCAEITDLHTHRCSEISCTNLICFQPEIQPFLLTSLSSDVFSPVPSQQRLRLQVLSQTFLFFTSTHSLPHRRSSTSCPFFFWLPETLTPWSLVPSHHHSPLHHSCPPAHVVFPPFQSGPSPASFPSISLPSRSPALPPSLASRQHPVLCQGARMGSCMLNEDSRDGRNGCNHLNQRRTPKNCMTTSRHVKITQVVKNKHEVLLTTVISWEREYFRKTL